MNLPGALDHDRPLITVCIANYNGMGLIDDCLQSVLGQTLPDGIEIIVHDDASSDGSAEYIRNRYPDVLLIESRDNVGFCIANNRMAAKASGRYILLLNNDAALFPDALETLASAAGKQEQSAILSLPQYDWHTGILLDRGSLLDPFLNSVPNLDERRIEVGHVAGACLWIAKALWNELGGFPEWFGSLGEDLYICCKARLTGHPVRTLSISGYRHRVGQSFGGGKTAAGRLSTTYYRRARSERNKTFVMAMTYPMPFMQIMLPLHVLLLLIEGCFLSLLHFKLDYLRRIYLPALAALYSQAGQLLAERHRIMLSRRLDAVEFFSVFVWRPYKLKMLWRHGLPTLH